MFEFDLFWNVRNEYDMWVIMKIYKMRSTSEAHKQIFVDMLGKLIIC